MSKEIVICAAMKSECGKIVRGHRHADIIYLMVKGRVLSKGKEIYPSQKTEDSGFITSKNRYVDRYEAIQLQLDAGIESVAPDGYLGDKLYSEDLY